jgi:endonuclease/exonuclease/phosphatase family metal-dependent hydrolase
MSIKLISLNVAIFEANNEKLHAFLSDQKADLLCLQEVTRRVDPSAKNEFVSKHAIDAASPELSHSFFAPIWVLSKFEKLQFHGKEHFVFDLGGNVEFGNYTRSRFPIQKGQNIFVQNHFAYVTDWSNWPEEDYRGFQVTDVLVEGEPLRLINYHGIWSRDKMGTEKTQKACEIIRECGVEATGAVIICGDFNLFPATDSIEVLNTEFTNLCNEFDVRSTRPGSNELSGATRNVVDYIFVNEKVTVQHFEVLQSDVSDHLPLVLEFELK